MICAGGLVGAVEQRHVEGEELGEFAQAVRAAIGMNAYQSGVGVWGKVPGKRLLRNFVSWIKQVAERVSAAIFFAALELRFFALPDLDPYHISSHL